MISTGFGKTNILPTTIPWMEKYRPEKFEDIIMDKRTSAHINIYLNTNQRCHLIITGMPGIGKTSTVRCIARKILGEHFSDGYLELNAAEDRGVRSISNIIPPFCKRIVNFTKPRIILLDEADNMTNKCQCDINDMMKKFGSKALFILTCNDSTKIIEDVQSACNILRFQTLTNDQIITYLSGICLKENIKFDKEGMKLICYVSCGDMRKAINNLQLTAYSFGSITKNNVLNICKIPDPENIKEIITMCYSSNPISDIVKKMNAIIDEGYCYLDIISSFIYVTQETTNILGTELNENIRLEMIHIMNRCKIDISYGIKSDLQLIAMLARLVKFFKEMN